MMSCGRFCPCASTVGGTSQFFQGAPAAEYNHEHSSGTCFLSCFAPQYMHTVFFGSIGRCESLEQNHHDKTRSVMAAMTVLLLACRATPAFRIDTVGYGTEKGCLKKDSVAEGPGRIKEFFPKNTSGNLPKLERCSYFPT